MFESMGQRKNPAAVSLGRKGGKKRAENRGWEKIPADKRSEQGQKAVLARWEKARAKAKAEGTAAPKTKEAKARKH